eukprot:GSMAST32.ASY1.ANO1.1679.1 assembled CDS
MDSKKNTTTSSASVECQVKFNQILSCFAYTNISKSLLPPILFIMQVYAILISSFALLFVAAVAASTNRPIIRMNQTFGDGTEEPKFDHQTKPYTVSFAPVTIKGKELSLTPFFSPDHSAAVETTFIAEAKKTLDVGTPGLTSWSGCTGYNQKCYGCTVSNQSEEAFPMFQSLLNAVHRGVKIRILTNNYETDVCDGMIDPITFLALAGASVSSINWSKNSIMNDREAGMLISGDAAPVLDFLTSVFESDWAAATPFTPDASNYTSSEREIISSKETRKVVIPNRKYITPVPKTIQAKSTMTMYTSPDHALNTLEAQLNNTKESLQLYMYIFILQFLIFNFFFVRNF